MNYSWYTEPSNINSPDLIHQILAYGKLEEILNLRKKEGREKLSQLFLSHPKNVYSAPSLHFIKKFILGIDGQLDEKKYLKNAPRYIRQ